MWLNTSVHMYVNLHGETSGTRDQHSNDAVACDARSREFPLLYV